MTTLTTPFGCYKYLRALYQILLTSKHNNRIDEVFVDPHDFHKIVDDVAIFDSDTMQYALL